MYLGDDDVDGERFADVSTAETAREVHQLRDCATRTREGDGNPIL